MKRVMKYKLRELLRSPLAILAAAFLLLMLNGAAIIRSGVLASGGGEFNTELKYALIVNNYGNIASLYGVLAAILLGAGVIGPDLATGNLFVLLTAYPARGRYFLACVLTVWGYLLLVQLVMLADVCLLLRLFSLPVRPGDLLAVFPAEILNSTVLFGLSAVGSVYCKGYRAAAVGISGWLFCRETAPETRQTVSPTDVRAAAPAERNAVPQVRQPLITRENDEDGEENAAPEVQPPETDDGTEREDPKLPEEKGPVGTTLNVVSPLEGELAAGYSMDRLSYNPTTRDWRTHAGSSLRSEMRTSSRGLFKSPTNVSMWVIPSRYDLLLVVTMLWSMGCIVRV